MNANQRFALLKDSIVLLRQVRESVHSESFRGLVVKIDEVILLLEAVEREGPIDPGRINEALKVLGQGLAAIPSIAKIIELLGNH